jgi:pimeloyl-ACP methyl ester carboxylesterase
MPATFVPIHAAGDGAWTWHLVAAELRSRGHDVVAIDLPADDESAGLWEYAEAVLDAIGDRTNLVVVAHSFGGFTAPLVCARAPVDALVLVTAMIPAPGEPPADWWTNTGYEEVRRALGTDGQDGIATYYHDVPPELAEGAMKRQRNHPSSRAYNQPWPLDTWPDVPTHVLLCRNDRVFPVAWMRQVVRARLGIEADEIESGHCPMLSRPSELARRLEAYLPASAS